MNVNAAALIAGFEGFSPRSFWDFKQWTWGYGTQAPGANATINKAAALTALNSRIEKDTALIKARLTRAVSPNAFASLLSFNYNLGFGNTSKLIDDLNAGKSLVDVAIRMKSFNKAGGVVNDSLVKRREKEAQLLLS